MAEEVVMRYVYNARTKEMHQLDADGRSLEQCNLDAARQSRQLVEVEDHEKLALLFDRGASKCGHCWPKED